MAFNLKLDTENRGYYEHWG